MKKTYRIVAIVLLLVATTSCMIQGVKGNGDIETQDRNIDQNFTSISVSQGIDVYLTTDSAVQIIVEADENIIDLILTEVHNGRLKVYLSKNIWRSTSRKVYISAPSINEVRTSSGAMVKFENTLKADKLTLKASSGSDIRGNVYVTDLECSTSSGADIRLSGTTKSLDARASSGSDIKAYDLDADYVTANASSGADIRVNVSKSINTKASSGGDVKYRGEPIEINKKESAAGKVYRN